LHDAAPHPLVHVLVSGYADDVAGGRQRCGCTITLIEAPGLRILVDTGDPVQHDVLVAALAQRGVAPSTIDWVINTHGHLDHVGNNNLFLHATFVLDTDLARAGEYWSHDFTAPLHVTGEPGRSIHVIATPGHSDHDRTVLVETEFGVVAIAGDLFEHGTDDADGSWQRWSRNPAQQRLSRDLVRGLADLIVPGHGPAFPSGREAP
jgi:glyoxylase-like metal-dependent hydrolase (beta-lactamase superfamily II)